MTTNVAGPISPSATLQKMAGFSCAAQRQVSDRLTPEALGDTGGHCLTGLGRSREAEFGRESLRRDVVDRDSSERALRGVCVGLSLIESMLATPAASDSPGSFQEGFKSPEDLFKVLLCSRVPLGGLKMQVFKVEDLDVVEVQLKFSSALAYGGA